uniref:hypothetical protein n=2 Tax=Streptococcus TaxID=1301 RepID=UPI001F04DD4B
KIVIKESGASGEVRTYEVLLKKDQETKAVTFELTDVTEKVEKMTVNYSPVYQPVSAPVVERSEELGEEPASEAPAVTSPEVKEETEAPVAPKETAPEVVTPAPKEEKPATPATKVEEPTESSEPKTEAPTTPENKEEQPAPKEVGTTAGDEGKEEKEADEQSGDSTEPSTVSEGGSPATQPAREEGKSEKEPKVEEQPSAPEVSNEGAESTEPDSEVAKPAGDSVSSTSESNEDGNSTPSTLTSDETEEAEQKTPEVTSETSTTPSVDATNDSSDSESSHSVTEGNKEETNSQNAEASTGDGNSESTTSTSDKAKREEVVNGTEETDGANVESEQKAETPKVEESEATTSGNQGQPVEESSETKEAESTPVTDNVPSNNPSTDATPSNDETTEQPGISAPKAEDSAGDTTVTQPAGTETSKETESAAATEEEKELNTALEEAKKENLTNIDSIYADKLAAIEKVADESDKTSFKAKLEELKTKAIAEIQAAPDDETASEITDKYQNEILALEVPGEEITSPNYNKDGLSNGRNDGTTIDNGSTVIGHGSGEVSSGVTQPEAGTEATQPATSANATTTENSETTQPTTENTSFRNAPSYQPRARRVARAAGEQEGTVNISYNFAGMPDINGFFADPGENNTVKIPNNATEEQAKQLVKAKIDAKIADLKKHGYNVKNEIIFEENTQVKNYNYIVVFSKETQGTSTFRIAPKVQVRAKKVVKRDLSNKTKKINIYYNLTALKDIAGALGEVGENNLLTLPGNATKEDIKKAVVEKTKAQIEKLKKQGFTVKSTTDLDQIVEGGDSYDYVVEFTKESKTQPVGTTGFRMAPAVQPRASRNRRSLEQPAPQKVKVNVFYNFDQMKDIAGFLGAINETPLEVAAGSTDDEVKVAVKNQVDAKKEELRKRGYTVKEDYLYKNNGKDYNYVLTFSKTK